MVTTRTQSGTGRAASVRARTRALALLVVVVATLATVVAPAPAGAQPAAPPPMIFVHGFMGSGQQFEAQALRFTSNGYPADHIDVFEHDSLSWPGTSDHQEEVWSRLDVQVDDLLASTGADQVNLALRAPKTKFIFAHIGGMNFRFWNILALARRRASSMNMDQPKAPSGAVSTSFGLRRAR